MKNLIEFKKNWVTASIEDEKEKIKELKKELHFSSLFLSLCVQRGLDTIESIHSFISPNEESLHDPYLMHNMKKAVERIQKAVKNNEKITVYGDYDADGVTSTAILLETLELLGINANFYIPNRFTDGYGPNIEAFNRIISDGTTLIITCDNGISGHEAIQAAVNKGVDVVVTDHHELPSTLPAAYAIVHPRHPEGRYPFGELSGAGVAFKLAEALLEEIPEEFYDLTAIGTVADVVSLTDENRFLVKKGIEALRFTDRIGLQVLLKNSDVNKKEIDEETIGFKIGPRLNALGRLGDASPAVKLLSTLDYNEAEEIAQFIDEKNEERKDYVSHITEEAVEQIKAMPAEQEVYVVAKDNWHEGVLGIVASKLVEMTKKPVIVLTVNKEKGLAKGSGRSVSSINLYKLLDSVGSLIDTFGGHHMAAGLSIQEENLAPFRHSLNDIVLKNLLPKKEEAAIVDGEVQPEECTIEVIKEIQQLAPFGTDNPFPLFMLKNAKAKQVRKIGADASHLKLSLDYGDRNLDTIGFGFGSYGDWLKKGTNLSLVGKLRINEWHGTKKVQLTIEDLEVIERQLFDYRKTRITDNIWKLPKTDYLFFNPTIESKYKSSIPKDGAIHLVDQVERLDFLKTKEIDRLVIVDCPPTLELLKSVLNKWTIKNIIYIFHSKENAYLEGIPSRKQFAKTYKYFITHQNIDIRHQLSLLSKVVDIKEKRLIFIINVFFEVGFVKIKDGILNSIKDAPKKDLTLSSSYQQLQSKIEAEEILLFSHSADVESWINQHANTVETSNGGTIK